MKSPWQFTTGQLVSLYAIAVVLGASLIQIVLVFSGEMEESAVVPGMLVFASLLGTIGLLGSIRDKSNDERRGT